MRGRAAPDPREREESDASAFAGVILLLGLGGILLVVALMWARANGY